MKAETKNLELMAGRTAVKTLLIKIGGNELFDFTGVRFFERCTCTCPSD
jgi:hypothetical protein